MTSIQDKIFTASNGVKISSPDPAWLEVPCPQVGGDDLLSPSQVNALREYFTAERDKELERWRSPEYPSVVVHASESDADIVYVIDEREPYRNWDIEVRRSSQELLDPPSWDAKLLAARAYFKAHPAPAPRPWEDAEDRSIWALTIDGRDPEPFKWSDRSQQFTHVIGGFPIYRPERITAGRQIWPATEEEGDDK